MKQLSFLSKLLFIALIASMVASCEDTGGGGGTTFELPPVIDLESGTDLVTSFAEVDAEDVFKVSIKADQGDNLMSTLAVLEDGIELDASRINLNGAGFGAFSNPYTFANSSEQASFGATIDIVSQSDASTRTYTFRVTDTNGNTDETTVDITTTIFTGPLSISFTEMAPFAWTDIILDQQGTIKFQVNASKGSSPMESLTVLEDGAPIADFMRLRYNTIDDIGSALNFDANPLGLLGDDQDAFSWVIYLGTHADNSTKSYTFRVTDTSGETKEVGVNITVNSGTAIVSDLTGKLLKNAGGPAGTGGIDLVTGDGTGSSDPIADLKDQGIDVSQPASSNWVRKVAPVNGSILKTPGADFPFTGISDIEFREQIQEAFDGGTTITESNLVLIGDVFIIQDVDGNIHIVEVTDVVETSGDNDDYYQLAIKR